MKHSFAPQMQVQTLPGPPELSFQPGLRDMPAMTLDVVVAECATAAPISLQSLPFHIVRWSSLLTS